MCIRDSRRTEERAEGYPEAGNRGEELAYRTFFIRLETHIFPGGITFTHLIPLLWLPGGLHWHPPALLRADWEVILVPAWVAPDNRL